jgi:hypothetical protein
MAKSRLLSTSVSRRRWTSADARIVLTAFEDSGLSVVAFAEREGLDPQRVYFWKRRLEAASADAPLAFVEVMPRRAEVVEIVLRSGRILRVPDSVDAAVLRQLVEALEERGDC